MINARLSHLIPKINRFLSTQPVTKAWIFGSYSRGEETAESDLDILVSYDYDKKISLLTVGHIITELEKLVECPVDLVSIMISQANGIFAMLYPLQSITKLSLLRKLIRITMTTYCV